jgi:hypothetical protein
VSGVPPSLGALPVRTDDSGMLLLPVADDEAFWIGLSVVGSTLRLHLAVAAVLADGREFDAISGGSWDPDQPQTVGIPETRRVDGIHRSDGRTLAFARSASSVESSGCAQLVFQAIPATNTPAKERMRNMVSLNLVSYETFGTRTGFAPPDPLDSKAGYKGWRLP